MTSDLEWLAGVVGKMTAPPWARRNGRVVAAFSPVYDVVADGSSPRDARGIAVSRNVMAALLDVARFAADMAAYERGVEREPYGGQLRRDRLFAAHDRLADAIRRERERAGE